MTLVLRADVASDQRKARLGEAGANVTAWAGSKNLLDLAIKADILTDKALAQLDGHLEVASNYAKKLKAAGVRPMTVKDMAAQVAVNVKWLK